MTMTMTRKHFLTLGVGAATAALLPGCGDDGGSTGTDADSSGGSSNTTPTTSPTTNPTTSDASTSDATTSAANTSDASTSGASTSDASTSDASTTSTGADSSSSGAPAACDHDPDVVIGTNHPMGAHALVVTLAEVQAGVEIEYDIAGASLHHHSLTLSDADFATLAAGGEVVIDSGTADDSPMGHTHQVTISCA